jgi:hypothetical protein
VPLTKLQVRNLTKAQLAGSGGQAVPLDTHDTAYLVAVVARDLGLEAKFPEYRAVSIPEFFEATPASYPSLPIEKFPLLYERLLEEPDAETYFMCLARMYKSRLKYERILERQAIPTMEQVGPRGLLQYGWLSSAALAYFLFWRKWMFDIDNRAGQETGYLFEPILASAIGGASFGASSSPIRRRSDPSKGRQVDCIVEPQKLAYEIKIRVTIAASGQGRWQEELDFPEDCQSSGYTPILVVLDRTDDPKLTQLVVMFERSGGKAYVGPDAWAHLDNAAGPIMARFLDRYVHAPLADLLSRVPDGAGELPVIQMQLENDELIVAIGDEPPFRINRRRARTDPLLSDDE